MDYDTAFRPYLTKRIEQIESADIIVGVPCYNNDSTIANVLKQASRGLAKHYKSARSVILLSDGGSTDDTREVAREEEIMPWQEKVIFIYRGIGGKGTALRAIFEAAEKLNARACAVVDADLRSITPDWVRWLLEPVLEKNYDLVAPTYSRYKYDGTITNTVAYNLTRALYGKRIRQPIGGDFGLSRKAIQSYLTHNVWMTDVARFGIDIWMTTQAIASGFNVCQANLGMKVHDPKDPGLSLGGMFRQVVRTLFTLMEEHAPIWKEVRGSHPVETFGVLEAAEPEPIKVNQELLIENFKLGFRHFSVLWREILSSDSYATVEKLAGRDGKAFLLDVTRWAHILYETAATFHHWSKDRSKLVDLMSPLYEARVASFINETANMTTAEAEQVIEAQAEVFEKEKPYLVRAWDSGEKEPKAKGILQRVLGI
ncbi:MAG TPA: glycosyltransferase family 2 protein [Candidatus Binatia bacterium]|nr:glycosyltransferase family 2 protein [Candidatus Binatia bacterium]